MDIFGGVSARPRTCVALFSAVVLGVGCSPSAPSPRAATSPTCAPSAVSPTRAFESELKKLGPAALTIDVVVHHGTESCLVGDARHVTVRIDAEVRTLTLPCYPKGSREWTIQAPAPTYPAASVVVAQGSHRVSVRDDDTGHEDFEELAVPHIELESGVLTVGAYVDAWVDKDATVVRGPTAVRVPGL